MGMKSDKGKQSVRTITHFKQVLKKKKKAECSLLVLIGSDTFGN